MKKLITILAILLVIGTPISNAECKEGILINDKYITPSNNTVLVFKDDSCLVYNLETRFYKFYPSDTPEDGIILKNINEVKNTVNNYIKYYNTYKKSFNNTEIVVLLQSYEL